MIKEEYKNGCRLKE
jgi:hypothetical protein